MTAWASKTYQGPQPAKTFDKSASSAIAADSTGTTEELGEAYVREDIVTPVRGMWPARVLQKGLLPQLFGDAKALERSEARDTLGPVLVLR